MFNEQISKEMTFADNFTVTAMPQEAFLSWGERELSENDCHHGLSTTKKIKIAMAKFP